MYTYIAAPHSRRPPERPPLAPVSAHPGGPRDYYYCYSHIYIYMI